jgi:hypothetical protein
MCLPKKDPHRLEAARWRLRFVVGQVRGFVPTPKTHQTTGVLGQSPLVPKKIRTVWRQTPRKTTPQSLDLVLQLLCQKDPPSAPECHANNAGE